MRKFSILTGCLAIVLATPALAKDIQWSGEGSLGAGFTTGNTENSDFGAGLKLKGEGTIWTHNFEAAINYAEADGTETEDRQFLAYQLDRDFDARSYGYGRGSYERDTFSGYDNRMFLGLGYGYHVIETGPTQWSLEAGPGLKIDDPVTGDREENLAIRLGSRFKHQVNEAVKITNDTDVIWTSETTQLINSAALTAALMNNISARFSVDVRHDTDPPVGREQTDTATRASLVYSFGS